MKQSQCKDTLFIDIFYKYQTFDKNMCRILLKLMHKQLFIKHIVKQSNIFCPTRFFRTKNYLTLMILDTRQISVSKAKTALFIRFPSLFAQNSAAKIHLWQNQFSKTVHKNKCFFSILFSKSV